MSPFKNSLQLQLPVLGLILCLLCESALAKDCATLASLKLEHATITSASRGWNDPGIAPGDSLEYRDRVIAAMGPSEDFYRLYMVPGMLHCGGGEGPSNVSWQAALESWVERSEAPGVLIATAPTGATQSLEPFK